MADTSDQTTTEPYPEHAKKAKVRDRAQGIGEFLEWAGEQGWSLMEWKEFEDEEDCWLCDEGDIECPKCGGTGLAVVKRERWVHVPGTVNDMLLDFFGLDKDKLEEEASQMLEAQRELNARLARRAAGGGKETL